MEKMNLGSLEEKLKRIAEENEFDLTPAPPVYINYQGRKVELVHYDGETPETSIWATIRNEDGSTECFETKYAKSQKIIQRLIRSGLGKQIEKYTFDNYQTDQVFQKDIKQKALAFVKDRKGWFAVLGQPGAGKSHICTATAVELANAGYTLEYMLWMESINKIKYNRKESEDILEQYSKADVLYIDDFFKTQEDKEPSKVEVELAFQILDARYRENKITIISSEKTSIDIESYDRAVYRRIAEMTGAMNIVTIEKDNKKDMSLKY